jgi:predicted nucleic acid-binding protein
MKTDLFVDTSGWAPFLAAKDPLHAQVAGILQQGAKHGRRFITTSNVMLELITLLERYRFSRARALEGINAIKATSGVLLLHVDEATDTEAWACSRRGSTSPGR